jgi:two-component system response regulator NreC
MVTVALADDHAVVRQGLRLLLESDPEFVVVGEAANGIEALKLVSRRKPKVLIVDLVMPGMDGLETTRRVLSLKLDTRVVILTMYGDEPYLLDALGSGASGYLAKESCADVLFQAIREVAAGRYYLSPALFKDFSRRYLHKFRITLLKLFPTLTTNERNGLQRVLQRRQSGAASSKRSKRQRKGRVASSLGRY